MKVKATFVFEFTPNTSGLSPEFIKRTGMAQGMAECELEYILDNGGLTPEDFDLEVIDDSDIMQ